MKAATFFLRRLISLGFSKYLFWRISRITPSLSSFFLSLRRAFSIASPLRSLTSTGIFDSPPSFFVFPLGIKGSIFLFYAAHVKRKILTAAKNPDFVLRLFICGESLLYGKIPRNFYAVEIAVAFPRLVDFTFGNEALGENNCLLGVLCGFVVELREFAVFDQNVNFPAAVRRQSE